MEDSFSQGVPLVWLYLETTLFHEELFDFDHAKRTFVRNGDSACLERSWRHNAVSSEYEVIVREDC